MFRLVLALALSVVCASAEPAYSDFLRRFWIGSAESGHLAIISQDQNVEGPVREMPPERGWLWQYAQAWNVLYAQWKVTGSDDARVRLAAEWRWVNEHWTRDTVALCGHISGTTCTCQDDSSWTAAGLLQLYEATRDRQALVFARAVIDCAMRRWQDGVTGGGLWYDDEHNPVSGKSVTNGTFALAMVTLYEHTGSRDHALLDAAKGIERWAAEHLRRDDGLYWMDVDASGTSRESKRPYLIEPTRSVVALFGNMGFAVLDARLYRITGDPAYRRRARATAAAILRWEVRDGVFLDDRDARTNGYAAWEFARDVLPIAADRQPFVEAYRATARSVATKARGPHGSYGADWGGPLDGVWASHGFHRDRLEISANAVIWPVVAQGLK